MNEGSREQRQSAVMDLEFPSDLKADLIQVMQLRGLDALEFLGSKFGSDPIATLCSILKSSPTHGLSSSGDDLACRRRIFGMNKIPQKKPKSFFMFIFDALKDFTLIILIIAAVASLLLSLYLSEDVVSAGNAVNLYSQNSSLPFSSVSNVDELERKANWIEATAIMVTVFIVAFVTAVNNYQKERQFYSLQTKIEADQRFTVVRNGALISVPVKDIVVGDICQLQCGDVLPADGLVVYNNDLKCDESLLTGDSDLVRKSIHTDPLLLSGTQVMDGSGRMLVIAVGLNSQTGVICTLLGITISRSARRRQAFCNFWNACRSSFIGLYGKADSNSSNTNNYGKRGSMSSENGSISYSQNGIDPDHVSWKLAQMHSPLQFKLAKLSLRIGYIGVIAAIVTILVLAIRFCIETFGMKEEPWRARYAQVFIRFIILGVSVIVVSVPEGLPLAVTLALAYSIKQMMRDNNLVRHLDACENMGCATTICCDKTGTLTTNKMSVVDAFIAGKRFSQVTINDTKSPNGLTKMLPQNVADFIAEAICVNTAKTSMVSFSYGPALPKHVGNKTECALLAFVFRLLPVPYLNPLNHVRENPIDRIRGKYPEQSVVRVYAFNSVKKSMSTAVRLNDGHIRLFVKGATEVILEKCGHLLTLDGELKEFSDNDRAEMNRFVIQPMTCVGLRTVCIAFRDYTPEQATSFNWDDEDSIVTGLVCIAVFGIADPLRSEVPDAIKKCQQAGVTVRMVTGDNIETARSVARLCGIIPNEDVDLVDGPLVLEGKEFNNLIRNHVNGRVDQARLDRIWPRLRVLARSTPEDKFNLVAGIIASQLSPCGEVVVVTGDGASDAPALREADVGFAMGLAGTDVAKEASDIILNDDNFASLVKALIWGRNVYDSIAKFIQFQLTVNIVASLITVIAAAVVEDAVVTAIQLLYLNLLMDTLASLALSTEPPSPDILNKPPYGRIRPLVSSTMAKNIIFNSFYQLSILLVLVFCGERIFIVESARDRHHLSSPSLGMPTQHLTAVFNVFVLMNLFNELCTRQLHNERNILAGLHRSKIFVLIWIGSAVSLAVIIQFGSVVFRTAPLTFQQWMWCLLFGVGQLFWNQIVATIPLERCYSFRRWFSGLDNLPKPPLQISGPNNSNPSNTRELVTTRSQSKPSITSKILGRLSIPPLETNF